MSGTEFEQVCMGFFSALQTYRSGLDTSSIRQTIVDGGVNHELIDTPSEMVKVKELYSIVDASVLGDAWLWFTKIWKWVNHYCPDDLQLSRDILTLVQRQFISEIIRLYGCYIEEHGNGSSQLISDDKYINTVLETMAVYLYQTDFMKCYPPESTDAPVDERVQEVYSKGDIAKQGVTAVDKAINTFFESVDVIHKSADARGVVAFYRSIRDDEPVDEQFKRQLRKVYGISNGTLGGIAVKAHVNSLLGKLPNGFRVRLDGSTEKRVVNEMLKVVNKWKRGEIPYEDLYWDEMLTVVGQYFINKDARRLEA